jgi:hypothetical protein
VRSGATILAKDHDHPALLRNFRFVSIDGWRIRKLPTGGERERSIAQRPEAVQKSGWRKCATEYYSHSDLLEPRFWQFPDCPLAGPTITLLFLRDAGLSLKIDILIYAEEIGGIVFLFDGG